MSPLSSRRANHSIEVAARDNSLQVAIIMASLNEKKRGRKIFKDIRDASGVLSYVFIASVYGSLAGR